MLAKMAEPFTRALDMLEVEKSAILGKKSNLFFLEVQLIPNAASVCLVSLSPHLAVPGPLVCSEMHIWNSSRLSGNKRIHFIILTCRGLQKHTQPTLTPPPL